jgi:subtilase family serine protease
MCRSVRVAAAVGAILAVSTSAWAAAPLPSKSMPAPRDVGALAGQAAAADITVTLPLKLRNAGAAESLLKSLSDKSSAQYHQFLTPAQFRTQFAPSDADVAIVAAHLSSYGLRTERTGAIALKVTGSAANMERAFQVSLHAYEIAAQADAPAFRYQAPTAAPKIPAEISAVVSSVVGLNTRPALFPHYLRQPKKLAGHPESGESSDLSSKFGSLTVLDFDKYYNVVPLSSKKITGEGRTIGIVTFASLTKSDPFAYWKALGLKVDSKRLTIVNVDGGPGAPSDDAGSLETTLDVEQSGGIAPGAKIIVYQAPNTDQGFIDAFVAAVESNKADSISVSWGSFEWFDNLANDPVTDPYTGKTVSSLKATHEIFLQAALQGESMFAASGDAGAYDANDGAAPPDFSLALSVDNPADDPYITAAGGTTLAGKQTYPLKKGSITVDIPHERVWSWDYLVPLCDDLGYDPINCGIFPVGSGGGVSFEFPLPFWQIGVSGIQKTQPDQSFIDEDTVPPTTLVDIPAYYAGRNVPDISFNADPDTGYVVYYTSSATGFSESTFWGGTSFVAPELNGVVGLIGQYVGSRVGLLNLPLYELAKSSGAYSGNGAPFNVIRYGNNDFYYGRDGYSPAVGIGTLDVANFAEALKKID